MKSEGRWWGKGNRLKLSDVRNDNKRGGQIDVEVQYKGEEARKINGRER